MRKKPSNKDKGTRFENKVRKTIMSGGLPTSPADLHYNEYAIECKTTEKKGFRISTKLLDKLWGQSLDVQKIPFLIIGIPKNEKEYYILKCEITTEDRDT